MRALSLVLNSARWRSQDRVNGKLLASGSRRQITVVDADTLAERTGR